MKATEEQILEMTVSYQRCVNRLIWELTRYKETVATVLRDHEIQSDQHDYTEFGQEAFLDKLRDLLETNAGMQNTMDEAKRLLEGGDE